MSILAGTACRPEFGQMDQFAPADHREFLRFRLIR